MKMGVEEAVREMWDVATSDGRVVVTNGVFDLLHPGHAELLFGAENMGELFVAVTGDKFVRETKGAGRPIWGVEKRIEEVELLGKERGWRVFEWDAERAAQFYRTLPPGFTLVKGDDHREEEWMRGVCYKLVLLPRSTGCSTSGLVARKDVVWYT
jgi:cytidyltransferase-like protein